MQKSGPTSQQPRFSWSEHPLGEQSPLFTSTSQGLPPAKTNSFLPDDLRSVKQPSMSMCEIVHGSKHSASEGLMFKSRRYAELLDPAIISKLQRRDMWAANTHRG